MKKFIAIIMAVALLFTVCVPFLPAEEKSKEDKLCGVLSEIAVNGPRLMLDLTASRIVGELMSVGSCFEDMCVLSEKINDCGWIEQHIDFNNDKRRDVTAVWQPRLNINTGVVAFVLYGTKDRVTNM